MTPRGSYAAAGDTGNGRVRGAALSPLRRAVAALALGAAALGLGLLSLLVVFASDPPVTPPVLAELFALQVALPAAVAWLVWRASAARAWQEAGLLVIEGEGRRIEVPLASIARVAAWRWPVPAAGLAVRLRSGARLPLAIAARDPLPLLEALAAALVPGAQEAQRAAGVVFAHARAGERRRGAAALALRYPGFALLPAAALFRVHQLIAFGGLFGEWYLVGPGAWLRTAFVHWGATTLLLLLYGGLLRGPVEALCLLAAGVAPARAAPVRRAAERVDRILYYGGVPALLALRFLA